MSDRNFTQRFDVVMTSLSSDKKITAQQCYICGERCAMQSMSGIPAGICTSVLMNTGSPQSESI